MPAVLLGDGGEDPQESRPSMINRSLSRRLERLEDRIPPPDFPKGMEVRFVSAETKEVTSTLWITFGDVRSPGNRGQREPSPPAAPSRA